MIATTASTAVPLVPSANHNSGLPYSQVMEEVTGRADLALPDQSLPLARLRATLGGNIEVPGQGEFALSSWSRRQLATILGIRWDRWFASETIVPADRAEEINRRFRASGETWKLRTRRPGPGKAPAAEGVLRAFVSPTYAPLDDLEVLEVVGTALGGRLDGIRFVRTDVTSESSQYAAVSLDEVDLGVGKPDRHRNGFLIGNSEVGSRSLTLLVWIWRLVCTNGLVAPDSRLLRLVHRSRKADVLGTRFAAAVRLLPDHWRRAASILRRAHELPEPDPLRTLEALIRSRRELRPIAGTVEAAYEADPEPTRFGVVQALTRAARPLTPERRLEVEEAAGLVATYDSLERLS